MDKINACFELFAGYFIWLSIQQIKKDQEVKGISSKHITFITLWGVWNLFYYPALTQWLSFAGGLVIVIMNGYWLNLIWRYK